MRCQELPHHTVRDQTAYVLKLDRSALGHHPPQGYTKFERTGDSQKCFYRVRSLDLHLNPIERGAKESTQGA